MDRKKFLKTIGIIVAFVLIVMLCLFGYRLGFKKDLEKINSPAALTN